MIPGSVWIFPSSTVASRGPSRIGLYCPGHPFSSGGFSTSLKPTRRVGRRLTVRYDGFVRVAPHKLATGSTHVSFGAKEVRAFPVPGRLAGSRPIRDRLHRLAGITDFSRSLPHYLWRQQQLILVVEFTRLALQLILVKGFRLYSFQLPDLKSPVLLFIVTTSLCQDWVICAPAAFLGCGSRFSGSLSGIEP